MLLPVPATILGMSTRNELAERAEWLREVAEREDDQTVAVLCRTLAHAYETLAAARQFRSLNQLH
jgi:hypothetical protein